MVKEPDKIPEKKEAREKAVSPAPGQRTEPMGAPPTRPPERPEQGGQPPRAALGPEAASGTGPDPQGLQRVLRGTEFPASRSDILDAARENNAPRDLLDGLRGLPDHRYDGPEDVMNEFKRGG